VKRAIVLLSDGSRPVARAADILRAEGFRVVATPLPQEFLRRCAEASEPLAAAPLSLVRGRVADYLRRRAARADKAPAFFVLVDGDGPTPEGADALGREPEELVEWASRVVEGRRPAAKPEPVASFRVERLDERPFPPPTPSRDAALDRLVAVARRLTELESDYERFLDAAIDGFLESIDAVAGSLLLAPEEGRLDVVRRAGYASHRDPSEIETVAAEAAGRSETVRRGDVVAAPMLDSGRVVGALVASGVEESDAILPLANASARQCAANLANARRLDELGRMSVVDPLTGLFNRRYFDRQLKIEVERAKRHRRTVSLAIVDIDSFKRFNGVKGYDVGDLVIRETAEVLRDNFREVDVVTRWGGDEFAVILPETKSSPWKTAGRPGAGHFIDRVRRAVASHDYDSCPDGRVTVSIGVAAFPGDAATAADLFRTANQALLEAKRKGADRVVVFGPEGREELRADEIAP
jgi:diguanylate cyclase (GGDEF)-like protein